MSEAGSFPAKLTRSQKLLEGVFRSSQALTAQEEVKFDAYCRISPVEMPKFSTSCEGQKCVFKKKNQSEARTDVANNKTELSNKKDCLLPVLRQEIIHFPLTNLLVYIISFAPQGWLREGLFFCFVLF